MVTSTIPRSPTSVISERAKLYPQVTDKIARTEQVSRDEALRMFEEALKFMEVAASHDGAAMPSQAVDVAWHHFILFTRDYARYCEDYLGRFIHHDPTSPGEGGDDAYGRTRTAIKRTFGVVDTDHWPPAASADCKDSGNCKSDCTGDCSSS